LVYCSEAAHINTSEANAAGFFGGGLKLAPVAGHHGRIDPDAFARMLAAIQPGQLHRGQPAAVNLTQASDLGTVYPLDEIRAIADKHGLWLFEDAACAAGATYRERPAGSFGDVGCFSTHPLKNLNAIGDGGFITTDRDDVAARDEGEAAGEGERVAAAVTAVDTHDDGLEHGDPLLCSGSLRRWPPRAPA
jgi:hypothetical protein